jgi:hypothetical protein
MSNNILQGDARFQELQNRLDEPRAEASGVPEDDTRDRAEHPTGALDEPEEGPADTEFVPYRSPVDPDDEPTEHAPYRYPVEPGAPSYDVERERQWEEEHRATMGPGVPEDFGTAGEPVSRRRSPAEGDAGRDEGEVPSVEDHGGILVRKVPGTTVSTHFLSRRDRG